MNTVSIIDVRGNNIVYHNVRMVSCYPTTLSVTVLYFDDGTNIRLENEDIEAITVRERAAFSTE